LGAHAAVKSKRCSVRNDDPLMGWSEERKQDCCASVGVACSGSNAYANLTKVTNTSTLLLTFSMVVENLSYPILVANASLLHDLNQTVTAAVSGIVGVDIGRTWVEEGSVIIRIEIPMGSDKAKADEKRLDVAVAAGSIAAATLKSIKGVSGIAVASTGSISVSLVGAPEIQEEYVASGTNTLSGVAKVVFTINGVPDDLLNEHEDEVRAAIRHGFGNVVGASLFSVELARSSHGATVALLFNISQPLDITAITTKLEHDFMNAVKELRMLIQSRKKAGSPAADAPISRDAFVVTSANNEAHSDNHAGPKLVHLLVVGFFLKLIGVICYWLYRRRQQGLGSAEPPLAEGPQEATSAETHLEAPVPEAPASEVPPADT